MNNLVKLRRLYFKFFGRNKFEIRKGNHLNLNDCIFKKSKIVITGKGNHITILGHDNFFDSSTIAIHGNNCQILIGENNYIKNASLWIEDNKSQIEIGDHNIFSGKIEIASVEGSSVSIGNNNLFSSNIHITTSDSHSILDINSGHRINPPQNIHIGDHNWIGYNVTILKGSGLTKNNIVGACSLLTKRIKENNVVIAGNPAKIIKHNTNWDYNRI